MVEQTHIRIQEDHRINSGARYEAAYAQIGIRIAARENMLIGYLAVATTLIGIALSSPELRILTLVIPHVAMVTTLILLNHENVIMQLEEYLADMCTDIPGDWYSRQTLREERVDGLEYRTLALVAVLGGSSVIAVLMGRGAAAGNIIVVWYSDIAITLMVILFLVRARMRRVRQYRRWIAMQH